MDLDEADKPVVVLGADMGEVAGQGWGEVAGGGVPPGGRSETGPSLF
jgi:hypothetical protein